MSPRRRGPGISIRGEWVAISRAYDDMAARNPVLSTDLRILAAGRSRLELSGHSHWRRGELRNVLATVNRQTGEASPLSKSALTRRIGALADAGLLEPGSWSECLRVPLFSVQVGVKGVPSNCPAKPQGRPMLARAA